MPAPTALPIPRLHPFVGVDVPWLLGDRVARRGDSPYIIWDPFEGEPRTWTYGEFGSAVAQVAGGLWQRGIRPGEFVLIHLGNCPEFLIAWHACSRIGAVAVTTNTRSSSEELAYYASNCGAVAAITQPALVDLVAQSAPSLRWLAVTDTDVGAPPASFQATGTLSFRELFADAGAFPGRAAEPLRFNSVQYTSGTTSRPKGVVWTHANVLWGARLTAMNLQITPDDVGLAFFPLFHTNSLMYASLSSLWAGAAFVLMPRYSASRFWDRAVRHRCTWCCTSPFVLKTLQQHPVPDDHRFRFWGSGTTDPPLARERCRVQGLGWFGMTETVGHPTMGYLDLPNRALAMGRPSPGYEVEVVREDGTPVEFGETGQLLVRGIPGLSLFYEYLNNPAATAAAFDAHGWMSTGDMVTPYADGSLRFEGRGQDLLRVGSENVAAAEIERVIQPIPGVFEVAVVAGPHDLLGEVPVAFVIPAGEPGDLAARILAVCADQLADFKVPREVIFLDVFPRSTLNKVSKRELRARLRAPAADDTTSVGS
ncbi:MAG: AMP-binding protein [Vicinamibacterales bacterium]